jgi:eukaryotic-like serine/threonine-protein kinase
MRVVREARAAGKLRHPNVVAVHDIGQVKGALYIVMEYVRGKALANVILGPGQLPLRSKLSIVAQVADALGYAHAQGVVHRDVKPLNSLIAGDEAVKVVDFRVAAQSNLPDSLVQGNGTVPYMSPEQLERRSLDAGSDIWSTGVTLFELLMRHIPYRSLREILSARPPELPRGFLSLVRLTLCWLGPWPGTVESGT